MSGQAALPELSAPSYALPAVIARNEKFVRRGLWRKLRAVAGRVPFAEDVVAAFYCAIDPRTPTRVRAVLLAALAYFIMPVDVIPDFVAGLGFTDDATVLATAIGLVSGQIKERHKARARAILLRPEPQPDEP